MFLAENRLLYGVKNPGRCVQWFRKYSRKNDSKNLGSYKIVNSKDVVDDPIDTRFGASPNWELFGQKGYRFMLPGSVGPAWHEPGSMMPIDGFINKSKQSKRFNFETLECTAKECPLLLKKSVNELFAGSEGSTSPQVTVVTLIRKRGHLRSKLDNDPEYHAKTFMWAAQEICMRLKMAGYWADFINPFSGRPYLSTNTSRGLYEADERFRCIGFDIEDNANCKIIQPKKGSTFIGNIFTNAPPSAQFLLDLLSESD